MLQMRLVSAGAGCFAVNNGALPCEVFESCGGAVARAPAPLACTHHAGSLGSWVVRVKKNAREGSQIESQKGTRDFGGVWFWRVD